MVPALELVRAADGIEDGLAGPQTEVVGVVEAEAAGGRFELRRGEAFEGGLRRDWHEYGERDGAVR